MAQSAHQFDRFEQAPREKEARLRSVQGGKERTSRLHQMLLDLRKALGVALFLGLAVSLLQSKATLTELTTDIQRRQNELTTAQSSYNYLTSELNSRTSMANVEETANRLGLMKTDESQITYICLDDSTVLTVAQSKVEKWTDMLYSGFLSLIDQLDL